MKKAEKLFLVDLISGQDPLDKTNCEFVRASQAQIKELNIGNAALHMKGEYLVFTRSDGTCAGMFLSSAVRSWREADESELLSIGENKGKTNK